MMRIAFVIFLALFSTTIKGLDNGLARTPPMGWLAWERYRCNIDCKNYPHECISEWLFRNVTDLMVDRGYFDVGYEYVIIDDCWLAPKRDEAGDLQPDPGRFPSGIKALADYIHSKGLKFGIYEDYGTRTCAGYPGILGNLERDAKKFAEWEVDYVKLDGCNSDPIDMDKGYPEFGNYLNQTGRPMVYSCSWPVYQEETGIQPNFTALVQYCNLWRNYDDIDDSWASLTNISAYFANKQDTIAQYAGPGHWNDPDMLLIGNFGLSYDQSKVQMAIWAILAAPLLMSTDLKAIHPQFKAILQNKDIIAVNQDSLGIQGRRLFVHCQGYKKYYTINRRLPCGNFRCTKEKNIEVWARPILPMHQDYYSHAVAFVSLRTDGSPYPFTVTLKQLGLYNPIGYKVRDLYDPRKNNTYKIMSPDSILKIRVNPTGVVFLHFGSITDNATTTVHS